MKFIRHFVGFKSKMVSALKGKQVGARPVIVAFFI